ncbi:hypothetical protein P261_02689 [Lachnospiraceae bacterium TWA4]|nr:hypothetical protein P261_02689 [Lachnospiraceae bacterium TWA4]
MKKITKFICFLVVMVSLSACTKTYDTPEALIEKVRKEIPISNADTIQIQYAGQSKADNLALLWFISGNEYQGHSYFPVECKVNKQNNYDFIGSYESMERYEDIGIFNWNDGYSFCVNNSNCKTVRIIDSDGTHNIVLKNDEYPYVFYHKGTSFKYIF